MKADLETPIIKTLAYADLFDQALSTEELQRYLVNKKSSTSDLNKEAGAKKYEVRGGLWCLCGREELFNLKPQQLATGNLKLKIAEQSLWLFKLCPWVKMVAVTGSVAGGSPEVDDDIDLIVITAKNRLWLSRFIITSVLTLLGRRRKPGDDPARVNNKLCLNMWLSEESLTTTHKDIYVANELAHMKPILNRDGEYETYIAANSWLENFLPNFYKSTQNSELRIRNSADGLRTTDWLDRQLEQWQLRHMRARTKETVTEKLLMFHPKDYRSEILAKHKKRLKELGI